MSTATSGAIDLVQDIAELRRRYGPSQTAFADRARITQAQVSLLERGKLEHPHDNTLQRIADACDISLDEVKERYRRTRDRFRDGGLRTTDRLLRQAYDLYPRVSEGQRVDLSARLLALGEGLARAFLGSRDTVNWFAIGAVCIEQRRTLDRGAWQADPDLTMSRAAYWDVTEIARTADSTLPERLELGDWERELDALTDAAREQDQAALESASSLVFRHALWVAASAPPGFPGAVRRFQRRADDLLEPSLGRGKTPPPSHVELIPPTLLLAGAREALR